MTFIVTGCTKTGTATFDVNPGALDHFAISTISSPQTAGTAITGITLTAQDVNNNTVTSFTGTVTYSGTAGITGTSAAFTAGVLTGVSVTPTVSGSGMTFVVTGSPRRGRRRLTSIREDWITLRSRRSLAADSGDSHHGHHPDGSGCEQQHGDGLHQHGHLQWDGRDHRHIGGVHGWVS